MKWNTIHYLAVCLLGCSAMLTGCGNDDHLSAGNNDTDVLDDAAQDSDLHRYRATDDTEMTLDGDAWALYRAYGCDDVEVAAPYCDWMICGNLVAAAHCRPDDACAHFGCYRDAAFCHAQFCPQGADIGRVGEEDTLSMGRCVADLIQGLAASAQH